LLSISGLLKFYGQAAIGQFGVHRVVDQAVPSDHFVEMPIAVARGGIVRIERARQVAAIARRYRQARQGLADAGHAQRFRAHAGATATRAHVGGCADQADGNAASFSHDCFSPACPSISGTLPTRVKPKTSFGSSSVGTSINVRPRPNLHAMSRTYRNAE